MGTVYSFKSVGKTSTSIISETPEKTKLPIGFKTPLRFGSKTLFEMNYELSDQISDNFRNLILTNWGERLGLFDFGANLKPILSNYTNSEDFDSEVMFRINEAVGKWMPYIDLEDYSSLIDKSSKKNLVPITFRITYNISFLNVKKRVLELTMYVL